MTTEAVTVKNFSLELGGARILNKVSFSIEPGEYVSIVGPNGAGKTSLLKCLNRVLTGGEGQVMIGPPFRMPHRKLQPAQNIASSTCKKWTRSTTSAPVGTGLGIPTWKTVCSGPDTSPEARRRFSLPQSSKTTGWTLRNKFLPKQCPGWSQQLKMPIPPSGKEPLRPFKTCKTLKRRKRCSNT